MGAFLYTPFEETGMKLQRKITIEIRDTELLVAVPTALDALKYEEAYRTAESGAERYRLSCELLEGCLEDLSSYPVFTVIEIAQKMAVYIFMGDVEKKPEDTP